MKINLRFLIVILALIGSMAGAHYYSNQQSNDSATAFESSEEDFDQRSAAKDSERDKEGDTFSIVAYDKTTGQVGGAGCSCVGSYPGGIDFLSDLITDGTTNSDNIVGAIHTQAAYNSTNQNNARTRMLAGDTPSQIVTWLDNNDSGGNSSTRQYGVVGVDNPGVAGFTGSNNGNYANHVSINNSEFTVSIQGNILDTSNGQDLLDDMQAAFLDAQGNLADRLMAALQAAKRVGGDNRCDNVDGRYKSGTTAFVQVLSPGETSPSIFYTTSDPVNTAHIEPIDILQCLYDTGESTPYCRETVNSFPYAMDFETRSWVREDNCNVNSSWIRSRHATPSGSTGPSGANQGTLFTYVEASDIDGQGTSPRNVYISSPCFDLPSNNSVTMTFDYHMYGSNMGTLSFEVSDNGGSTWSTVWSETGDKGNTWFNDESVDLSSFSGSTIKIRVNALTGNGFRSDFGLDDIQISTTPLIACTGTTYTWNGSTFSPAGTPGDTDIVIINGDYSTDSDGDLTACTLTVNTGSTLTVDGSGLLDVDNDITVDGSLIIDHTGILVQTDPDATITNNGTINVNVTTPVLQTRDFMVMGSPLSAETRNGVFNSAFLVLEHNPANFIPHPLVPAGGTNFADDNNDYWSVISGAASIEVGEGYIVRPQSGYTDPANTSYTFIFSQGVFNNGFVNRSITYNGAGTNPDGTPNIVSNPYPSPISADAFISGNALVNELFFWEHLSPPSASIPGAGSINFSMDDISIYNMSGGTAAANDPGTTTEPNGVISTAQGFGIKASGSGTVTFDNSMRLTNGNNTLRTDENDIDRLWLNVSNNEYEVGSNMLIAFNPDATDAIDPGYDSERLATSVSIYSHLADGSEELAIQTLEGFDDSTKIPLGFATQVKAELEYTISIANIQGDQIQGATVYLIDNENLNIANLSAGDYIFKANAGNYSNRFTIQFDNELLSTGDHDTASISIYPNPAREMLNIQSNSNLIDLAVYDIHGRNILSLKDINTTDYSLPVINLEAGIYFLKIKSSGGSFSHKFIKK